MNKTILTTIICICSTLSSMGTDYSISSPNGELRLTAGVSDGKPYYQLRRGPQQVISISWLGLVLQEGDLSNDFRMVGQSRRTTDETWTQVWGEDETVRNHYNELTLHLRKRDARKIRLDIVFRIFDDGMALRYIIPEQPALPQITVMDEKTQFALPSVSEAWSIPMHGADYYEGIYIKRVSCLRKTVSAHHSP